MSRGLGAAALAAAAFAGACSGAKPVAPRAQGVPLPVAPALVSAPAPEIVATPPAPALPASPSGAPPPPGALWGTEHPLSFVAASPDRRWLSICQARRDTNGDGKITVDVGPQGELGGDAFQGFFLDEPGPGTPIDAFVGSDPTGRFVAFVRDRRLILRDTLASVDFDLSALGADVRDDQSSFVAPRAGAFDPTGRRFLYLRREDGVTRVVVRDLATSGEAVVEPGAGDVFRAGFDPSGEWVVLRVVAADTNGNGWLEWPAPPAAAPHMRCGGPIPRFSVFERGGDEAVVRVARATGGAAVDAPNLVVPIGDTLIERNTDGMLVRGKPGGGRSTVIRAGCGARLLHADAARNLLLVTCAGPKGKSDAILIGKDVVKPMGIELAAIAGDRVQEAMPRLVALHPGADAVLIDLETRRLDRLPAGDRVLSVAANRALVLRKKSLVLHEAFGQETVLPGEVAPVSRMLLRGGTVVVPPYVVDVARGTLLGFTQESPLAVSTDGAVLSAAPEGDAARNGSHAMAGPLKWSMPAPALAPRVR